MAQTFYISEIHGSGYLRLSGERIETEDELSLEAFVRDISGSISCTCIHYELGEGETGTDEFIDYDKFQEIIETSVDADEVVERIEFITEMDMEEIERFSTSVHVMNIDEMEHAVYSL